MSYQLIAFDMDGTLLNSEKKISAGTMEALKYAVEHGKTVALCTGRALCELKDYENEIREVGIRYVIGASGGYVYDVRDKVFLYMNVLSEDHVRKIMDTARHEETMVQLMSELSIVNRRDVDNMEAFRMSVYQPMYRRVSTMVEDVYAYYEENRPKLVKINIYHHSPEERERTLKRLTELGLGLEVVRSEITSVESSNKGVSKAEGLRQLCSRLSIDTSESIAVGDADNDLNVLAAAGLGIAMGNANENVKRVSGAMVRDNDHDGCAEAIYEYLMK